MIGVDTGPEFTGIASFDGVRLHWARKMPNADILAMIHHTPEALAGKRVIMEMVENYGKIVGATVFHTCREIGRIQEACIRCGAQVTLVTRREVKMHLCGTMKAGDPQIRRALCDRFGEPGTIKNQGCFYGVSGSDQWSAIALATWGLDNIKNL